MTQFEGRVAFVTGAASGIGLAIAHDFAKRGANVMLADVNAEGLAEALASFEGLKGEAASVVCDVADPESVRAAAKAVEERFGKLHYLVNNAGVSIGGAPGSIPLEDWRWIVGINLMGVVHGVEIMLPMIRAHGEGGHIVNTASMAGHWASPMMGPYNATKFAVVGYTETLRQELADEGIGVSALCPGWVKSSIHTSVERRPSAGDAAPDPAAAKFLETVAALVENGLPADLVAEWTLDCIVANRAHIFTDAHLHPAIEARCVLLEEDYKACLRHRAFQGR